MMSAGLLPALAELALCAVWHSNKISYHVMYRWLAVIILTLTAARKVASELERPTLQTEIVVRGPFTGPTRVSTS